MVNELKITSLEDIKKAAEGEVVELPPFTENIPFVARLKRPSMLSLAKSGKIPNSLLGTAQALFEGNISKKSKDNGIADVLEILEIMAEAALVEPTYDDIKNAGLELADDQLTAIFNYTQEGVAALNLFRRKYKNSGTDNDVKALSNKTKRNPKYSR